MTNKFLADTHLHDEEEQFTAVIGMIILIRSLTMLFIALIASYGVLRVRSVNWHSHPMSDFSFAVSCFNTILILFSSYSFSKIMKHVKAFNLIKTLYWINFTIGIGVFFLFFQSTLWYLLTNSGYSISSHQAGSVFYMLSGLHGLHIIMGIISLLWLRGKILTSDNLVNRTQLVGIFWHFLTFIWLVLFFSVIIY
jgi:cytochrome c oxidase subunit 3